MPETGNTGVGKVIDPTKNVLDLVEAGTKYQDAMREAETRRVDQLAAAETRRVDQLLAQARTYEERIANMLAKSVETSSGLLSTALSEMRTQLGVRISEVERFRYESSGKTSVADPAISAALSEMAANIAKLRSTGDVSTGQSKGVGALISYAFGAAGFVVAIISIASILFK